MPLAIRILSGSQRGTELELETPKIRVGDDPESEIFFDPQSDSSVMGRRAVIRLKEDGWYAQSTGDHPVLLNHTPLTTECRIRSGDVLRMSEAGPDLVMAIKGSASGLRSPSPTHHLRAMKAPATPLPSPPSSRTEGNAAITPPARSHDLVPKAYSRRLIVACLGISLAITAASLWSLSSRAKRKAAEPPRPQAQLEFDISVPESVAEGRELSFQVSVNSPDQPRGKLIFSLTGTPPAGSSIEPTTGRFRWTPGEDQGPGKYLFSVRVRLSDDANATTETSFWIEVQEVNSAPVLERPSEQSVEAGKNVVFSLRAADPDQPANKSTFCVLSGPPWITVESATGMVHCSPPVDEHGAFEATVRVTDDGQPALSDDAILHVDVRGDPWRRMAHEVQDAVGLVQMEVQSGSQTYCWPYATCCAIDPHTLLVTAREVLTMYAWHQQGRTVWIAMPTRNARLAVTDFRVHHSFVPLADKPGDWIFANLGLLIVEDELPKTIPLATAEQQQNLEDGLPIGCYGFSHDGGKVTRFDKFEAQLYRGEIYFTRGMRGLPEQLRLLEIQAEIPQNVLGSPILTEEGTLIGVYGNPANVAVKNLHYATALDLPAIQAWRESDTGAWVTPPMQPLGDPQQENSLEEKTTP